MYELKDFSIYAEAVELAQELGLKIVLHYDEDKIAVESPTETLYQTYDTEILLSYLYGYKKGWLKCQNKH